MMYLTRFSVFSFDMKRVLLYNAIGFNVTVSVNT